MTAAITVTTANICGNPIRAKVAVRARMRQALRHDGIVFGQEVAGSNRFRIGRGDYSTLWHNVAANHHKTTYGGRHEVPISVPRSGWVVQGHQTPLVHHGLARVSPDRFYTEVRTVQTSVNELVAFIDCHPPSKPRPGVDHAEWRMTHWDEYHAAVVAAVARLHDQGYTVVVGGDMNKVRVPQIHPEQINLVHRGLDHLWVVPAAGKSVTITHREVTPRTVLMDHPILSVTFEVR